MKKAEINIEIMNILKSNDFWDRIVIDEFNKRIVGEIKSREIIFMCAMGSLVKNCSYTSFNLLMHSESSAGKDYITKNVLKIIPSAYYFTRTRISPTVLNYWRPFKKIGLDSWEGCVLYLPDISEPVLNSDAMKLLCSDGSHITITEKGEARDIEIKGKPVIFSTTATTSPSEEILNRFSIVHLDESEEQTKRIMKMQSKRMIQGLTNEYNSQIKQALCALKRYEVKIPFADKIVEVFPSKRISERRNFERFFDFIKAITCVHQYQRFFDGEYLIAELEDYDKAKDIFMNIQQGISSIPLNMRQKEIVEVLKDNTEMLFVAEIHKKLRRYIFIGNLRPHLESLVNLKVVDKYFDVDSLGREIIKYKLSEEYLNFKPIILPNGIELDSYNSSSNSSSSSNSNSNKI
ncbi:hypothetical protein LCGC14_0792000 [marine sediment metagenome]|uniref:Uncharacterized protein n=1 Tax=marine sediment metagenome TaxID=412755 RepID=A0A0F9PSC5_9ZZZZ